MAKDVLHCERNMKIGNSENTAKLIDLGRHQKEFQRRTSFAYTVVNLDETQVGGCVYINPTRKSDSDAVMYLWARSSVLESGLEERPYAAVKTGSEEKWPFHKIAFPGREIGWEE